MIYKCTWSCKANSPCWGRASLILWRISASVWWIRSLYYIQHGEKTRSVLCSLPNVSNWKKQQSRGSIIFRRLLIISSQNNNTLSQDIESLTLWPLRLANWERGTSPPPASRYVLYRTLSTELKTSSFLTIYKHYLDGHYKVATNVDI